MVTILPLIVGALSAGLIAVFSLQSGVANRLSHTADAQAVSANFSRDIQGAQQVTTQASSTPECGAISGRTQLLGLASNLDAIPNDPNKGQYLTMISYLLVPGSSSSSSSLIRTYCTRSSIAPYAMVVQSQQTLAYDVAGTQVAPTITCVLSYTGSCATAAASGFLSAQNVSQITFPVNDPSNNYPYKLVGSPNASTSTTNNGSPLNSQSTSTCALASPGSGTLAPNLCFVDFSPVSGAALLAAQNGGCLEMSVSLPNDDTMFFCLSLSGTKVLPWYLPTYSQAFLGNSINGVPFYTGVSGEPALYQRAAGTSVITFSNISVVSQFGVPATGWEAVSTDAESTDSGESITWTSDATLNLIANGETGQIQPMGNACLDDGSLPSGASGLTGAGTSTVKCSGTVTVNGTTYDVTNGQKTGAAMVWAAAPSTITATLVGTGLEAISFGMLLP